MIDEPRAGPDSDQSGTVEPKVRLVKAAVKVWTGELVDLGGRNTLLYYRDLKQGTLDLSADVDEVVLGDLLSSGTIRLSALVDDATLNAAARRARTIRSKAQENFEERGLQTLFLAWGMATWNNTRVPQHHQLRCSSVRPVSSAGALQAKTSTSR